MTIHNEERVDLALDILEEEIDISRSDIILSLSCAIQYYILSGNDYLADKFIRKYENISGGRYETWKHHRIF